MALGQGGTATVLSHAEQTQPGQALPRHKSFFPALKATKVRGLELQPAPGLFPAPAVPGTLHSSPVSPKCHWLPAGWKFQSGSVRRSLGSHSDTKLHRPEHRDRGSGSSHKHGSQAGPLLRWHLVAPGPWEQPPGAPKPRAPALVKPGAPRGHDLCLTPAKSIARSAPEPQEKSFSSSCRLPRQQFQRQSSGVASGRSISAVPEIYGSAGK